MSLLKLPSGAGGQQSPSEIIEQSHAFVIAATRLRELHFDKAAAMLILANSLGGIGICRGNRQD